MDEEIRFQEIKQAAWGLASSKWQTQDLNPHLFPWYRDSPWWEQDFSTKMRMSQWPIIIMHSPLPPCPPIPPHPVAPIPSEVQQAESYWRSHRKVPGKKEENEGSQEMKMLLCSHAPPLLSAKLSGTLMHTSSHSLCSTKQPSGLHAGLALPRHCCSGLLWENKNKMLLIKTRTFQMSFYLRKWGMLRSCIEVKFPWHFAESQLPESPYSLPIPLLFTIQSLISLPRPSPEHQEHMPTHAYTLSLFYPYATSPGYNSQGKASC